MTLKEYLNQKDPVKMPNVVLKKKEMIIASKLFHVAGDSRDSYRVYINSDNPLVAGVEYLLKGNHLYTVDSDGNKKSMSCFRMEDNITKLANGGNVLNFEYSIGGL